MKSIGCYYIQGYLYSKPLPEDEFLAKMSIAYHEPTRSPIELIKTFNADNLIYAIINNITAEKKNYQNIYESERKFRYASEHNNTYAWEYTIATKEMRPCFRCMRDLGLPPLIKNYPEPVIESGLFQPDYRLALIFSIIF